MPAQFIRDEAFAFKPITRAGNRRWSIDDIINEASRNPDRPSAWRHVPEHRRLEPIAMTDTSLAQVRDLARLASQDGREENGRRFRSSGLALVSRVVSYPVRADHFGYPRDVLADMVRRGLAGEEIPDLDIERLARWAQMSVAWSRRDLGGDVAAVMHLDEECGHCHILRPLQIDPETGVASLAFWRPAAAAMAVRRVAEERGHRHSPRVAREAFSTAAREVADDYYVSVSAAFGHERMTEKPRKRDAYRTRKAMTEAERQASVSAAETAAKTESERAVRAERERDEQRARAERAEAEARSLTDRLAAADAEVGRLRDKLRQVLDRARVWFGALRGEPAAVRDATEAPTVSECKIDRVLGVSRDDLQRGRVITL